MDVHRNRPWGLLSIHSCSLFRTLAEGNDRITAFWRVKGDRLVHSFCKLMREINRFVTNF